MKTKKNKGGALWNVLSKGINKDKTCENEYKDYYSNWKDNPEYTSYDPLQSYPSKTSRNMYNAKPQLRSGPKCSVEDYNTYKIQQDKLKSPTIMLPVEHEILYTPNEEPTSIKLLPDEEESVQRKSIVEEKSVKTPSVITLSITAHGLELNKKMLDIDPTITIQNCAGKCGVPLFATPHDREHRDLRSKLLRNPDQSTISNIDNYDKTVVPIYKKHIIEHVKPSILNRLVGTSNTKISNVRGIVTSDEYCSLYHPVIDKLYVFKNEGWYLKKKILDKLIQIPFEIRIEDIRNSEILKPTVIGGDLFTDEIYDMIYTITRQPDNLLKYGTSIFREYSILQSRYIAFKQLFLSDIIKILKLLKFDYINIVETSCRGVTIDLQDVEIEHHKKWSDISHRRGVDIGGKKKRKTRKL
jgi:hypothetical protein